MSNVDLFAGKFSYTQEYFPANVVEARQMRTRKENAIENK